MNVTILGCMKMLKLKMPPNNAILQIEERIEAIKTIKKTSMVLNITTLSAGVQKPGQ